MSKVHAVLSKIFLGALLPVSFVLVLLAPPLAAQEVPKLEIVQKSLALCNNADQKTTPDAQAEGCTALIKSGAETPRILAIAYNNRGNTFAKKGDLNTPSRITTSRSKPIPNMPRP